MNEALAPIGPRPPAIVPLPPPEPRAPDLGRYLNVHLGPTAPDTVAAARRAVAGWLRSPEVAEAAAARLPAHTRWLARAVARALLDGLARLAEPNPASTW